MAVCIICISVRNDSEVYVDTPWRFLMWVVVMPKLALLIVSECMQINDRASC